MREPMEAKMSKHRARIERIETKLQPGDQFYLGEVWIGDQLTWINPKPPPGLRKLEIVIGGPEILSRSQEA